MKKKATILLDGRLLQCRRRPIFPGSFPPSIFGTNELNYRVRDGNGWTLIVIYTDSILLVTVSVSFNPPVLPDLVIGDPYEIRTRVAGVRGRSLRPLDQRARWYTITGSNRGHPD